MADDVAYLIAAGMLNAVVAAFPAPPDERALPLRQYVSPGTPAWDCDAGQVTAQVTRIYPTTGPPWLEGLGDPLTTTRAAAVEIEVVRCVPTDAEPDAGVLEDRAIGQLRDVEAVIRAVLASEREITCCLGATFDGWQTNGPSGGLLGGAVRFRAGLC